MSWLDGKSILVTGGAAGIGRAVVNRFVEEGANVGVMDIAEDKLETLRSEHGENVVTVSGDVTDYADNERAVTETVDAFGSLDVFVGNAGVFDNYVSLAQLDGGSVEEPFTDLFGVNVLGYILGAKAALSELVESEGRIVFTASSASFHPGGGGTLYIPSKHAVAGLVRQLAFELGPRVSVNGVAPGYIPTDFAGVDGVDGERHALPDDFDPGNYPLQFTPTPADYTGPYVLLASEENSKPMTGTIVSADLGRSIAGTTEVSGRALEYITEDVDIPEE